MGALWATVRDLKDGAVDPEVALRGLDEGYFDEDDSVWLRALFSLHAAIDTICRTLAVGTPDDLANAVRSLVPESNFLGSLQQVLYYGFYDLTQVQLSLFEAVVKRTPTTLFFPSEGGTTGTFARRFFERYIVPLASGPNAIANCSPKHEERDARLFCPLLTVHSVIGAEEELSSVCRQILDLVETHGYQFDEIGMVGRTLEPYQPYLASIFDRYRVPFTSTSGRPLIHEPLAKLVLQLATVPLHDGYRGTVLDAITSPLYRSERHARAPEHVRPDLWKVIAQALSIAHGRDEWARLERGAPQAWSIGGRRDEDATEPTLKVSTGVTRMLWETVSELLDECDEIPTDGTPGELVSALLRVVARHVTAENPEKEKGDASHRTDAAVWESLDAVLASVSDLDRIGERFTWTEFTEVLTHAMERATMPFASTFQSGVAVLDAMEARGRSFRALFVVGMNEQVFPRYVREDPFLRDRHRRVLADTLGFKVDEKLSAYDEEALLFTLLCRSAKNHLVLSVQRADGQGRPLVESPYVSDVERILETGAPPRIVVPRTLGDRVSACPEQWKVFAREDLAVWLVLRGQDPSFLLDAVGRDSELYRKGVEALAQIESSVLHVSDFDGMTGPLQSVEQRVEAVGLSPTALERYGRCPFQYYCADVLDLKPILSAPSHDLDPRMLGTLCHTALRETYAELMALGWPQTQVSDGHIAEIVQTSVARATIACENQGTFGPYLLWQLAQEQVCFLCAQVIELDHADYLEQGFLPVGLEMAATGYLTLEQGDGKQTIKIHGRADRLDQHRERGSIRVVDYKFTLGSSMSADDRKLDQAALRGVRLQPPIYSRLHFEGFPPPPKCSCCSLPRVGLPQSFGVSSTPQPGLV